MRMTVFAAMAAVSLGAALAASVPASAQNAEVASANGKVFGYQDASTGKFRPAQLVAPDVTAAPTTGTITATLTIKLTSVFPAGFKIVCGAEIEGQSIDTTTGAGVDFEESSSSLATVNGTTATCTVKTPYAWALPGASATVQDFVTGEYSVNVYSAGTTLPGLLRSTEGPFLHLTKLPAFGTVTSVPVSVTL
jgi:hypothetical protein